MVNNSKELMFECVVGIHCIRDLGIAGYIEARRCCLHDLLKGKREGIMSSLARGRLPDTGFGKLVWSFPSFPDRGRGKDITSFCIHECMIPISSLNKSSSQASVYYSRYLVPQHVDGPSA